MYPRLVVSRLLPDEELRSKVTPEEWQHAERMGTPRRRSEWLTWRSVVRDVLGRHVGIGYNTLGAPQVDTPHIYISVSHCREGVAVMFAERRCAVDMESAERNFARVAPRYLSGEEARLGHGAHWAAVMWSAKETLYKYAEEEGADFLDDLRVVSHDPQRHRLTGCIRHHKEEGMTEQRVELAYLDWGDSVLVHTL